MKKKALISFFILNLLIVGLTSTIFLYPERTQNFVMETLNLKTFFTKKIKNFIAKKINDKNLKINIEKIYFLKPDWPNLFKIELKNVNVYSLEQERMSNINKIELGFKFDIIFKKFFLNESETHLSYVNFKNLTLNAKIENDKFLPGPLVKILSLIKSENYESQLYLKQILKSKLVVGKVNLVLMDNRNIHNKQILEIKCDRVVLSEDINKSRSLEMECNQEKNNQFSIKALLNENLYTFKGKIRNIDPNLLFENWINKNLNVPKILQNSKLNGNYIIKTNKFFNIQSVNFVSEKSTLNTKNNKSGEIYKTKFTGKFSWEKENNLLKFYDLLIDDQIVAVGKFDLISKKGSSNLLIKKISIHDAKILIKNISTSSNSFFSQNFIKNLNYFKGGNLNNVNANFIFSLEKKFDFNVIYITTNFSNVRFEYKDKMFKKIISTISGDLRFKHKSKKTNSPIVTTKFEASDGFILFGDQNFKYKFSKAKINSKFENENYVISRADFFKKNKLEYSFNNVKVNQGGFTISRLESIKDKKINFILNDTIINKTKKIKSLLIIKNNKDVSTFLKRKLNIELIGDNDLKINLSGNLENLDFKLNLNSDLTKYYLNLNYLDLIKKKNIPSYINSEIFFVEGKVASLKNTHLYVGSNNYKIGLIEFNKKNTNKILLKDLLTPNLNVDRLSLINSGENINIKAVGKKIDLSRLKKILKNKNDINRAITVDLTADLIKLNSKTSLTGNIKGKIKDYSFNSIAYGKILLGGVSLLDNGRFKIYVDNEVSELEGLGLVGGAETRINLQKKVNGYPSLIFDTSDGGKLLSALGFTKNIKSGKMKIDIIFLNDEFNHYKGNIKSKKFSLINAPGIINSLSVLSISGIGSIISGEGVFFDKGQVKIEVKNKNFNFDKLYLSSESLGIAARGNINLKKQMINMTGSVAPIKLISRILSVVPAIGELLTGLKKEGLIAGQFKMQGAIENPKTKFNTMSFAPGILRDLFSEDWLENKNFFINRTLN